MTLKTHHPDLERARRMLFLLLVTYGVSGWMIDRSYHTEYFLISACCGAVHRLQLQQKRKTSAATTTTTENDLLPTNGALNSALSIAVGNHFNHSPQSHVNSNAKPTKVIIQAWINLGLLDVSAAAFLTWATLYIWDYLLKNV